MFDQWSRVSLDVDMLQVYYNCQHTLDIWTVFYYVIRGNREHFFVRSAEKSP